MPFTFAHPAIVLPFGKITKKYISFTGLVLGSMLPDFEYFIRLRDYDEYGHTVLGIFYFDLPLGLILFFIYRHIVKDQLIDHLPSWFNERLSVYKTSPIPYSARYILIVIASIIVGTAFHIFWDDFTHRDALFVRNSALLQSRVPTFGHHRARLFGLLQGISSILGMVIILITIAFMPRGKNTRRGFWIYWFIVCIITGIVMYFRYLSGLDPYLWINWIVTIIAGWLLGIIIASLISMKQLRSTGVNHS